MSETRATRVIETSIRTGLIEVPANIIAQLGGTDLLMCGSDYPHSEGTSTPLIDYAATGLDARTGAARGLFNDNVAFLLRKN